MIGECGAAWDWSCYSPMDSRAGSPKILTATTHRSLAQWTVVPSAFVRERERANDGSSGADKHPADLTCSPSLPLSPLSMPSMCSDAAFTKQKITAHCSVPSLWLLTDSWTESALNGTDPRHTSAAADAADIKRKRNLCVIKTVGCFLW